MRFNFRDGQKHFFTITKMYHQILRNQIIGNTRETKGEINGVSLYKREILFSYGVIENGARTFFLEREKSVPSLQYFKNSDKAERKTTAMQNSKQISSIIHIKFVVFISILVKTNLKMKL